MLKCEAQNHPIREVILTNVENVNASDRPPTHPYLSASPSFLHPHKLDELSHNARGSDLTEEFLSYHSDVAQRGWSEDGDSAQQHLPPKLQLHRPAGGAKERPCLTASHKYYGRAGGINTVMFGHD